MTRAEALSFGVKRYNDGVSCPYGHGCERYASTENCVECLRLNAAKWREQNRQHTRDYAKRWAQEHPDCVRKNGQNWYTANKAKVRAANAKWHKENPLGRRLHEAKRRERAGQCVRVKNHQVLRLKKLQKEKCGFCFGKLGARFHVDHVMPLALGGKHTLSNLQLLCAPCNQAKHSKHPINFAQENGRLL